MSYKNLILRAIEIGLISIIFIAPNFNYPTFASIKQSESKVEPEIDYEKSHRYHNLGIADGLRGEVEAALENFNKAIAFNPENATAYLNRGNIYIQQSKWDLALADHNKAIELDPKISGRAYFNRAGIYQMREQLNKAIADYNMAVELRANYDEAYLNRGIAYLKQENWQDAMEDFATVMELNPEDARGYLNLGFAQMKLRQWNNAIENYGKAIAIDPNNGKAYYNRATAYTRTGTGNRVKAIADLKKARDIFLEKGDTVNYQNVMRLLQKIQQPLSSSDILIARSTPNID